MTPFFEFEGKSAEELDRWCAGRSRFLVAQAENLASHPNWGHKDMCGIGEECRLVAFNQMTQPSQGESGQD